MGLWVYCQNCLNSSSYCAPAPAPAPCTDLSSVQLFLLLPKSGLSLVTNFAQQNASEVVARQSLGSASRIYEYSPFSLGNLPGCPLNSDKSPSEGEIGGPEMVQSSYPTC